MPSWELKEVSNDWGMGKTELYQMLKSLSFFVWPIPSGWNVQEQLLYLLSTFVLDYLINSDEWNYLKLIGIGVYYLWLSQWVYLKCWEG